jgi:hypothetical protein
MLRRLADPFWFQAFGCVLGFDWHSSGVTTVTCGAMKEAYRRMGSELGVLVAGGKGATSRKTPGEIARAADELGITGGENLVYASRMSAKVDSAAVQDGYQLYHHCFFFTPGGEWCVVQQGMNERQRAARRYHWLGEGTEDFVCEPHAGIEDLAGVKKRRGDVEGQLLLNMVAREAGGNRQASVELVGWNPDKLMGEVRRMTAGPTLFAPDNHAVLPEDVNVERLERVVREVHERHPGDFAALLGAQHVGPATVRALSLVAEVIYGTPASHRDPATTPLPTIPQPPSHDWAKFSYAHGGKDRHPYPVDRTTYDHSVDVLTEAVRKSRVGETEKTDALKRLAGYQTNAGR